MIIIKVRVHKIKLNQNYYTFDEDGYAHIDFESESTVKDLMVLLQINSIGKVIIINGFPYRSEDKVLKHNDKIEIFQLIAGG